MEKSSKYHRRSYVGKGIKGADENGYEYLWESSHPELEPTSTFKVHYDHYCTYCCEKAYPIQEGLRSDKYGHISFNSRDFTITGYTCICEGAEKEKEFRHKIKELEEKHKQEIYELKKEYKQFLKEDKKGRLDLQYKIDLYYLEFSEETFKFDE